MVEGLSKKKRGRRGRGSSTSCTLSQANVAIEASWETGVTNAILSKLTQCKSSLQDKLYILNRLDEILDLVTEDEVENEIKQADIFNEKIRVMIDLDRTMSFWASHPVHELTLRGTDPGHSATHHHSPTPPHSTRSSPAPPGSLAPLTPTVASLAISTHTPVTRVKLPKLVLKKFNRDLMKWAAFWDTFESSVHNNTSLSDVDKFNYLNAVREMCFWSYWSSHLQTTVKLSQYWRRDSTISNW